MTIDEQIAVMQAFKEGKTIEFKNKVHGGWSVNSNPAWNFNHSDYRVKPEPEPPKYEPFSFEDDLVGKVVCGIDYEAIISGKSIDCVFISGFSIDYEGFLRAYKFKDGSPCGKLQTNE